MEKQTIIVLNDDSVTRAINKTAKRLGKQYSLKKKNYSSKNFRISPAQKIFNICFDVVSVLLVVVCAFMCFSIINSKLQKVPPTFAGNSVMRVSSGSMVASGFEVGDYVAVKRVNTKTLKPGDIIAFYVYSESYSTFNVNTSSKVEPENIAQTQYINTFSSFLGIQSKEIISASKDGSIMVIHEIQKVFDDENGKRWFKTKGTSNPAEDTWFVAEDMVVGLHTQSKFANIVSIVIGKVSSSPVFLLLLILIPILLIAFSILKEYSRDLKIACIENEIVRGKRKLNDPFCVENKIGTNLSEKEKLKVLAQADDSEKLEYINLMWRDKKPIHLQKHFIRKRLKFREYEEKLKLHQTCEKMFEDGKDMKVIATYYTKEHKKIEDKQLKINKRLKHLRKRHIADKKHLDNQDNNIPKKSKSNH